MPRERKHTEVEPNGALVARTLPAKIALTIADILWVTIGGALFVGALLFGVVIPLAAVIVAICGGDLGAAIDALGQRTIL